MPEKKDSTNRGSWLAKNRLVVMGFLAIAAYLLWTEHRAHVFQYLPFALLLLCPLLHFFHGGHGGHGGGHHEGGGGDTK